MMTDEEMKQAEKAIRAAENKESYPFEFDVEQYKSDFATLMATLEEASAMNSIDTQEEEMVDEKQVSVWSHVKRFMKSKYAGYAGSAAAAAAVTIVSTMVMNAVRKEGIFR